MQSTFLNKTVVLFPKQNFSRFVAILHSVA